MKAKKTHFTIICISIIITLVFSLTLVLSLFGTKANADTYTVYDDGEYYSETTYYLTKSAYNKYLKETGDTTDGRKSVTKSAVSAEDNESEFVVAATKKLYIYEAADENGIVIDSRPLNKTEINQYIIDDTFDKNEGKKSKATAIIPPPSGGGNVEFEEPYDFLGKDSTTIYGLTIVLTVKYEYATGLYIVSGTAKWNYNVGSDKETVESTAMDFIGLTWGGDKAFRAQTQYVYGEYYNNSEEISFSKRTSDSYTGFVWQFEDMSGNNPMNYAVSTVGLNRIKDKSGNEANAKLTYIHTYKDVSGSISLKLGTDGLAAEVLFSAQEKYWQIEVDVPGLKY